MNKEALELAAEEYTKSHVTIFSDGSTDRGTRQKAFKDGAKWNEEQLKAHIIEYIKKCPTITKYHKTLYCIDLEAFKENI